jgi:hypothetical protein
MPFHHLPLLATQRKLHELPRGWERFRAYIATMTGGGDDIELPLMAMNPMGKEHVVELLDRLLALGAEETVAEAVAEAARRLPAFEPELRLGMVVSDDLKGGWTNRYFTEIGNRFDLKPMVRRGFAVALWWTSEEPWRERVREEVLATAYRSLHFLRHGPALTLRQRMAQEGRAATFAGAPGPALEADDLAYSREVIAPHLESDHKPTIFACLYGDEAARSVGYSPLGLSARAGFAVALADTRAASVSPEAALAA